MASLISYADIKAVLGIATLDTTYDAYLQMVIDANQEAAETYCQRRFSERVVVDKIFDGTGGRSLDLESLDLRDYPLKELTSLSFIEDEATPTVWTPFTGAVHVLPDEFVINDSVTGELSAFDVGVRNFKISYKAGETDTGVIAAMKLAFINWGIIVFNNRKSGGPVFQSETIGTYSYKVSASILGDGKSAGGAFGIPQSIMSILDGYYRPHRSHV